MLTSAWTRSRTREEEGVRTGLSPMTSSRGQIQSVQELIHRERASPLRVHEEREERRRRKSKDDDDDHHHQNSSNMGGTRRHSHGVLRAPPMSCNLCPPSPTFTAPPASRYLLPSTHTLSQSSACHRAPTFWQLNVGLPRLRRRAPRSRTEGSRSASSVVAQRVRAAARGGRAHLRLTVLCAPHSQCWKSSADATFGGSALP